MGFEKPTQRIRRIKDVREVGTRYGASMTLKAAVEIDELYAESFDLTQENWERELRLAVNTPEPYNWKLDMPWVVGTTLGNLTYSLGRFADRQSAIDFQSVLLDQSTSNAGDKSGTFIKFDPEL